MSDVPIERGPEAEKDLLERWHEIGCGDCEEVVTAYRGIIAALRGDVAEIKADRDALSLALGQQSQVAHELVEARNQATERAQRAESYASSLEREVERLTAMLRSVPGVMFVGGRPEVVFKSLGPASEPIHAYCPHPSEARNVATGVCGLCGETILTCGTCAEYEEIDHPDGDLGICRPGHVPHHVRFTPGKRACEHHDPRKVTP